MIDVIGVRFKKACKIYYFDPLDCELSAGDGVIVETVKGIEYGDVVIGRRQIEDGQVVKPLKPILRKASQKDLERLAENKEKEKKAFAVCKEKIAKHELEMKLISVEYTFDSSKIIFSFTAEGRVDFRELVKDLAAVFKTRIELRQIGVRDETKMIGGLGPCGRAACCSVFLGDFQPVSIKMAKEQNLSLSPTKISGLCGRLMCCLNYEQAYYEEQRAVMPRVGAEVRTPDGKGTVTDTNVLKQLVKVRVELGEEETDLREYSMEEITILRRGRRPRGEENEGEEGAELPEGEEAAPRPRRNDRRREGRGRDRKQNEDEGGEEARSDRKAEEGKEAREPRENRGERRPRNNRPRGDRNRPGEGRENRDNRENRERKQGEGRENRENRERKQGEGRENRENRERKQGEGRENRDNRGERRNRPRNNKNRNNGGNGGQNGGKTERPQAAARPESREE